MNDNLTIKLQIALNRKMYEQKRISYNIYSSANEILNNRLTNSNESDIISHSERIQIV